MRLKDIPLLLLTTVIACITMWMIFRRDPPINDLLDSTSGIDSMHISSGAIIHKVMDRKTLTQIGQQMMYFKSYGSLQSKGTRNFWKIRIWSKGNQESLRFLDTSRDGLIFEYKWAYFKNDDLSDLVRFQIQKQIN